MARPSNTSVVSPPHPGALATPHTLAMKTPLPSAIIDTETPTSALVSRRKRIWDAVANNSDFDGFTCTIVAPPKPKTLKTAPKKKRRNRASHSQPQSQPQPPLPSQTAAKKPSLDANNVVQPNPFPHAKLAETNYSVAPAAPWECTTGYRIATIGKNEFKINQYVFVEIPDELRSNDTEVQFWVARILEIRAGSKRHVYLRVYWMYRPEDLPGGRQLYHGECELIASNHMDIIEVASVHEPVDVYHWSEDANDETVAWPAEEQLFWRQTFDVTKHPGKSGQGQFSKLPMYCIDKAPSRPDEPLVQCDSCLEWLHASCLEEQAVRDAASAPKPRGRPRKTTTKPTITATCRESEHGIVRLTVTTQQPDQPPQDTDVDVTCLMCSKPIASERLPEEHSAAPAVEPTPLTDDMSETEDVITVDVSDADATESDLGSDDELANEPASSASASSADAAAEATAEAEAEAEADVQEQAENQPTDSHSKKRKRISQSTSTPLQELQNDSSLTVGLRSIKRILFR